MGACICQPASTVVADQRPDAVLWAALMAGDQFAFDGIYDRHVAAVYRVAARRVGVEHAEDLTSAVFTEMWTHRQRIRLADPGGLGPWLMGTTINLARRHHERTAAGTRMIGRVATGVSHEPDHADQVIDDLADAAGPGPTGTGRTARSRPGGTGALRAGGHDPHPGR